MTLFRPIKVQTLFLLLAPLCLSPGRADGAPLPAGALARMGTTRLRQGSVILAMAVAPDGRTAASAGRDGTVRVWELPTGRELRRFFVGPATAMGLAFAPNGKSLAVTGGNSKVRLWDVATGRLLREFDRGWGPVAFSRDGRSLAAASDKQGIRVWDTASGKELFHGGQHKREVVAIVFSADGKEVAAAGGYEDRAIRFRQVATGKEVRALDCGEGRVEAAALAPDGRTLALAGWAPGLQLLDAVTGKRVRAFDDTKELVQSVAFAPDGKAVVSGARDGTVCLWDVATGKELRRFAGPRGAVRGVGFSADGTILAAGGDDRVLHVWDAATGKPLGPADGHRHRVTALHWSADGKTLTTTSHDRTVRTWDAATGKELKRREGPAGWLGAGSFSPDGAILACPSDGETVRLWKPAAGTEVCQFKARLPEVTPVAFAPNGGRVVTMGERGEVAVRETASGKLLHRLVEEAAGLVGAAWSGDGKLLASAHQSHSAALSINTTMDRIVLWDATTGTRLRAIPALMEVSGVPVAFAPDGRTVACLGNTHHATLRTWETATGKVRRTFRFRTPPRLADWGTYEPMDVASALACSPDGRLLALGLEQEVYLWDAVGGEEVARFSGHGGKVTALAFAPDGTRLASAGDDTTVLVWDLAAVHRRPVAGEKLAADALDALWSELGSDAPADAMARLVRTPAQAVALLGDRLRHVAEPEAGRVSRLLADLESDRFTVRDRATHLLGEYAELIEADLRKRLASRPAEEVRRRLDGLLHRLQPESAEQLRRVRALEVLEHIASPEARDLLERLARGPARARFTAEVRASLARLGRRAGPRVDAYGDPLPPGAIARLGTVRLRHADRVAYAALSPDGTLLASGNSFTNAVIQISQTATGRSVLRRPEPEAFNVSQVAFTPDNKILAVAGQGISNDFARVYFWNVADGKELRRVSVPVNKVPFGWVAAFAPDGKTLATGCDQISLVDVARGAVLRRFKTGKNHTTALAFAPDGGLLAMADEDGSLCLWDAQTAERLHAIATDLAYTLAFSADGKLLAAAGPGRPVRLWEVTRGPAAAGGVRLVPCNPPRGHERGATVLACSKDGKLLGAGASDDGNSLWDVTTGKRLWHRDGAEHVWAAGFDPHGRPLVVAGARHAHGLRILDVATGREVPDGPAHHQTIVRLGFSPDGKTVGSLCAGGVLHLWRAADGKHLARPAVPDAAVQQFVFTPNRELLVSAGDQLYRGDGAGTKLKSLSLCLPENGAHVVSPDGRSLAVVQSTGPDGKPSTVIAAYHPERTHSRISLWDVASGKEFCRLPPEQGNCRFGTFATDCRALAFGQFGGKVWEIPTGRLLYRLADDSVIRGLVFAPSGRLLAVRELAAGRVEVVSLWEVASGQLVRRCKLPAGAQPGFNHGFERLIAFSPDGRILATDTYCGEVYFWDVFTGEQVHKLTGQGQPIGALAFAPDGKTLAAGNADTTVLLWDITAVRPLPLAAGKAPAAPDKFWEALADRKAAVAWEAVAALAADKDRAVAWLRERLAPAPPFDDKRLNRLIADLGRGRFDAREKAMRELETLGEAAEVALRRALTTPLPLEVQRRAEMLLGKMVRKAPERLRELRAVEVLEQIGTAEARRLLERLADGAPQARLTEEAKVSLGRLRR